MLAVMLIVLPICATTYVWLYIDLALLYLAMY